MTIAENVRILCSLLLLSTSASAEHIRVVEENVAFLYEARAELPVPDEELAKSAFTDYANAKDEFSRHDIFQRVKPIIEKRLAEARDTKLVYLTVSTNLGDYDFERKSFPTGFSEGTFIPFRNKYAVTFVNGVDVEYMPVAMEAARSHARELQKTRRGSAKIYGEIQGASEKRLNYATSKALSVRITRIELSLQSGTVVGSKTP
jgi:hypothetical protein